MNEICGKVLAEGAIKAGIVVTAVLLGPLAALGLVITGGILIANEVKESEKRNSA